MSAMIDTLRRGVPAGLEELAQLGRTLRRRRARHPGVLRPPRLQRAHRSHQRPPGSPAPQRTRIPLAAGESGRLEPLKAKATWAIFACLFLWPDEGSPRRLGPGHTVSSGDKLYHFWPPVGRDLAPSMLHRRPAHGEAVARITWCTSARSG